MSLSTSAVSGPTSIGQALSTGGSAGQSAGISFDSFLASLVSGLAVFGLELVLFLLLHDKFVRI